MKTLRELIKLAQFLSPKLAVKIAIRVFATPQRHSRPNYENEWIQGSEKIVFECGLHGLKFGKGPPVLLVHGWEGRGSQLCAFAEPLMKQGFSVFALDGPGHGDSPGSQTTPVHFARFVMSVAQELGPLKALVSHSFGAACATLAVNDGLKTESLILIAGPDQYSKVVDYFCQQVGFSEETRKLFHREVTLRVGMTPESMQVSKVAKNLNCRILVVHDEDDRAVPINTSENIHSLVKGSEFLRTKGLGHRRILSDPTVLKSVVEFISRRS